MAKKQQGVSTQLRRATFSATVTRADGTVEDLGVISDTGDLARRRWWQRRREIVAMPVIRDAAAPAPPHLVPAGEYDPAQRFQHAAFLYAGWDPERGKFLADWLSQENIDANVASHHGIQERLLEAAENGDMLAQRALGW